MRAVPFALAALLVASTVPSAASADEAAAETAMQRYFDGEKRGGVTLMLMGAVGLGAGALLATRESDLANGAGYVGLGIGTLHLAAGVFIYVASAARISKFRREISEDERGFALREGERMDGVKTQFFLLKIAWGVLIAGGTGTAIVGVQTDRDLLAGVGIGLATAAAATLVFDIVAARRASRYADALEHIGASTAEDSAGRANLILGVSGSF